jgi:gliding motility-associated-like protein
MKMMSDYVVLKTGKERIMYFLNVLFIVLLFSKGIFAQAPTAFLTPVSPPLLCETDQGIVAFNIIGGAPTYTLYYTINGAPNQVTTTNTSVNISQFGSPGIISTFAFELTGISDRDFPIQPLTGTGQTYTLTFQPKPVAIIAVSGTTVQICPDGGIHTVTPAFVSKANGNVVWTTNGLGELTEGNTTSPSYKAVLGDAGLTRTLTMKVESDNICASSSQPGAQSATDTYTIPVRPAINTVQELLPAGGGTEFCQFDPTAQIKFSASGGTTPYFFNYSKDGNTEQVQTAQTNKNAIVGGLTQELGHHNFYLESVQDANCTQSSLKPTITISVTALPAVSLSGNPKACKGDADVNFKFKIDEGTTPPYTINYTIDGEDAAKSVSSLTDSLVLPTTEPGTTTYSITSATDALGCKAKVNNSKAVVTINQRPNARFSIDKNRTSILEPQITITDLSIATDLWYWDFGDSSALFFGSNPGTYAYKDTGTYNITLIAANNACGDTTSLPVRIYMPYSMYVPNAFTPNGDGVNDKFAPEGEGFLYYDLSIFDRWGNKIYYTTDIKQGWDGKANGGDIVRMNSCVYVINIVALDKKTYSYSGTVTIPK